MKIELKYQTEYSTIKNIRKFRSLDERELKNFLKNIKIKVITIFILIKGEFVGKLYPVEIKKKYLAQQKVIDNPNFLFLLYKNKKGSWMAPEDEDIEKISFSQEKLSLSTFIKTKQAKKVIRTTKLLLFWGVSVVGEIYVDPIRHLHRIHQL